MGKCGIYSRLLVLLLSFCVALEFVPEASISARPDPITALEIRSTSNIFQSWKYLEAFSAFGKFGYALLDVGML